jgi:hypothetical protein
VRLLHGDTSLDNNLYSAAFEHFDLGMAVLDE